MVNSANSRCGDAAVFCKPWRRVLGSSDDKDKRVEGNGDRWFLAATALKHVRVGFPSSVALAKPEHVPYVGFVLRAET